MAAEKKRPYNKGIDWDKERSANLEMANEWILNYKSSGFSKKTLVKCKDMTLNQVALITKVMIEENGSVKSEKRKLPDTFYFVWQKSYTAFYEKIGWRVSDIKSHITHIDSFLNDEYSFNSMYEIIGKWKPEDNDAFEEFVINYRLPKYFKDRKTYLEYIDQIGEYHATQRNLAKVKSKYEGYKPILYTVLLEIKDLPHKVLIFIYLALNYSSNINFRIREFFDEKFSCKLKELYDDIDSQSIEIRFNKVFEEKYGNYLLKKHAGDLYKGDDYKEMISLAGDHTIIEDLITSIFFWYNYKNYPDNPDYENIRNVISQWNTRFKEEARALLRDKRKKMGS